MTTIKQWNGSSWQVIAVGSQGPQGAQGSQGSTGSQGAVGNPVFVSVNSSAGATAMTYLYNIKLEYLGA